MSFAKRHSWVPLVSGQGDKCIVCGLQRKRVAIRTPLNYPTVRKWRTGFFYFHPGEHLEPSEKTIICPDCHG